MFARLRPGDVGVKVGEGDTAAAHRVADPAALADLLGELLTARRRMSAG
jgi:trehalose 6-phosphate phosphatase